MQSNQNENKVLIRGRLESPPRTSHINHGVVYYVAPLAVRRLSGAEDHLNVVATAEQLAEVEPDDFLTVRGEVRTFNNRSGRGNRLIVSVFARQLTEEEGEDENRLELSGVLCKPPTLRVTPLVLRRSGLVPKGVTVESGGVRESAAFSGEYQPEEGFLPPDLPERRTAFSGDGGMEEQNRFSAGALAREFSDRLTLAAVNR